MAAEPGTFERIAILLGDAFAPLGELLQPERAGTLLAELGLSVPATVVSPALRAAFGSAATAAGQLPGLVGQLTASINVSAGGIQIGAKAVALADKVRALITAFDTIGTEVGRLAGVPGVTAAQLAAFAGALPGRLLELVLVEHLEREHATFSALLSLLGVIERTAVNPGSTDPFRPEATRKSLHFDRLGAFFQSPEQLARDLYGWGQATFDSGVALDRLYAVLTGVGLPVARSTTGAPPRLALELLLASVTGTTGVNPPGLEARLRMAVGDGLNLTFPIGTGLEFELGARGGAGASVGARFQPPAQLTLIPPSGSVQGEVTAGIAKVPVAPQTVITLLGVVGGTRLEAQRLSLAAKAHFEWDAASGQARGDVGIEGRLQRGKLVISLAGADGFVGTLVGGAGLEADFDLGFGWSAGGGVYFTGSGALEIRLPTHVSLGPIEITGVTLRIGVAGASFPIQLTANVKGALGPMTAIVEDIGVAVALSFPANHAGNLGMADVAFSFKPPTGVGLALDAGVVKGGGFLSIDAARGEYAGVLELVLAEFLTLRAIGLITTRNPDGSPGFSLLIVITAEFGTGIQLGFGFTLLAVGGLVGLNRTMRLEALMQGVRTGSLESVMFPEDVIANAPRILSDLRNFFPPQQGTFLIGPMLKLGWGTPTLVSVSVGVIIEIPGNIALVGVLKVALPADEVAILVLQVNFAGAIEFDRKRLYFFASLYDSRVLFITIEGEMGLLVAWGDDANFVLSVGGFHPRFSPPPLPFPSPNRTSINLINESYARIRSTGYFAVTSNTAQFGSSTEVFFGFSAFSVTGHIGFDALFQFSPFHFEIDISASFSLRAFGVGVFSVRVHFTLSGPTPWRARGSGSISLLFFEISADFDITWGESRDTALEPVDVFPMVVAELQKAEAWTAALPPGANLLVTLRPLDPSDALVLHPVGTLRVTQRAVPLDLTIDKVGNRKARDTNRLRLEVPGGGLAKTGDLDERFAIGQFQNMDDARKLSSPAFGRQHGGVELSVEGSSLASARMVKRTVRYEEIIIDNRFRRRRLRFRALFGVLFDHLVRGNSVAQSSLSQAQQRLLQPFDDRITVHDDSFVVASTVTNAAAGGAVTFGTEAAARDHLATLVAADPSQAGALHVIPAAEMAGATA